MSNAVEPAWRDVPLFQGSDAERIRQLREDFTNVITTAGPRRLTESPTLDAAKAYDDAVADALPRAVIARVQAVGRKVYRHLLAENPPREGNELDTARGFNCETMPDALLEYFDGKTGARSVTAPSFNSGDELVTWLDSLSDGHFSALFEAAVETNEGGSPDPKASLTSRIAQVSDVTSSSPERLA